MPTEGAPGEKIKESFRAAVARSVTGRVRQEVEIGPHHLTADVPLEQGGEDGGARPREIVSAALAACLSMTVNGYARRKGWPLSGVVAVVQLDESAGGKSFKAELGLEGLLSADQAERLLKVASQCSVGQLLAVEVQLKLREPSEKS